MVHEYDDVDAGWLDRNYTGAPDECNIHWPTKGIRGLTCPDCFPEGPEPDEPPYLGPDPIVGKWMMGHE